MIKTAIITCGGLGKLRPAPGTWGSLPPCIIAFLLLIMRVPAFWIHITTAILIVIGSAACIVLGKWAEHKFQGKDPGVVVMDEVAGMAIALQCLPLVTITDESTSTVYIAGIMTIGAAFILFRIFDIIKMPPANLMEQFPAGWGILLDDIVAGLYVNIILQLFLRLALPGLTAG